MTKFKKNKKKSHCIGYDFKFCWIKNKYLNNKFMKKIDKLPYTKLLPKKVKIIEKSENIEDYMIMDLFSDLTISNKTIDEYNDLIKKSKSQEDLSYLIQPDEFIIFTNKNEHPVIYETDEDEFNFI